MKKLSLLVMLAFATSIYAQTEVVSHDPRQPEEGITYFLPKTMLHIIIHAEKTTYFPGEYAAYAQRYLRVADAPQQQYDNWELKSIEIQPFGVADTRLEYTIKLKAKTSAPFVGLAPDGRLLCINTALPQIPLLKPAKTSILKQRQQNAARYKTQEILAAGSISKMAELCANEIYDIRENRSALAKGQAEFMPKDGQQLQLMFENLNQQEAGLMELFTGTSQVEENDIVLDFPCDTLMDNIILCRFSKHLGVVESDNLSGEPIYISLQTKQEEPVAEELIKNAVRYVIPRQTEIRMTYKQNEIASECLPMAQFGKIATLGNELFNKHLTTRITFSPTTGGIVKVEN